MTKIAEEYPMGNVQDITTEELARRMEEMYRELAIAINQKADVISRFDQAGAGVDGQTSDVDQAIGAININQSTDKVEVLTSHTDTSTVVWTQVS